jgi:phosphoglycerol transferase
MYITLSLSILLLVLAKTSFFEISKSRVFVAIFYINLVLLSLYFFIDYLSGDGINDAILFHFKYGIKGFGIDEYIFPSFVLVFINIVLIILIKLFNKNINKKSTNSKASVFPALILIISVFFNPFYKDVYFLLSNERDKQNSVDNNHFFQQDILFKNKKKNVIFIYLEQVERTYLDDDIFPDLAPNLKRLEKLSVSYTNIDSPRATNWTIAGMAASQCGVPLLTPIASENSMSGVDKFIPLAKCMGDILNEENYNLHYIGGSDLDFAGKGNFYRTHGFNSVEGWYELEDKLNDKNYRSPWGVYDDELFDLIYERIQKLSEQTNNFGLFSLTLDTHHPNGYISASCKNKKYLDGKNPILNSLHCIDYLIGKFMDEFLNSDLYKDTTLVLLSDHLALKNTASHMLEKGTRKNLFMIFDQSLNPQLNSKKGNIFDVGPTVLGVIGTDTIGLGLGRNLGIKKSLSSNNDIDEVIALNRSKIIDLWSFPRFQNGFSISKSDMKIIFGDRFIKYPALIALDANNEVEQIMFDFYYANPLKNKVKRLDSQTNFLWIDKCQKIAEYKKIESTYQENHYCILLEDKKNIKYQLLDVDSKNINKELIKKHFNDE